MLKSERNVSDRPAAPFEGASPASVTAAAVEGCRLADGVAPEDPGWGTAARRFLPFILLPALATKKAAPDEPRIVALRTAFLAFLAALLGFLVVLVVLFPLTSPRPVDAIVYGLVAVGPLTLAAIPWGRSRLLRFCGTPSELAGVYASTMFISVAFVESAALFGFVATFLAEALWPYLAGMLFALIGFAAIAPTSDRIRRLDENLSRRGCHRSLRAGLYTAHDVDDAD